MIKHEQSDLARINQIQAEKLVTIPHASELLGLRVHALRRAVKLGLVPAYQPFNSRIVVKPSEVMAAVEANKVGGQNDE